MPTRELQLLTSTREWWTVSPESIMSRWLKKRLVLMKMCEILIPFQGFLSFWRGNVVNVVRYFPTQVSSDSLLL